MFDNSLANISKSSTISTTFGDNKNQIIHLIIIIAIKDGHKTDTINDYNNYDEVVMRSMQSQMPKSDILNGKRQEEMIDEDM